MLHSWLPLAWHTWPTHPATVVCHPPTLPNVAPLGGAAVAEPVTAEVAAAVSRMGAPRWGMTRGRVLEAGTVVLPTLAVALTT